MNLDQFIYIREVLHTKSITIAAEKLHVTQSAISQAITAMEREVGILLFNRSRVGTTPTEQGKPILSKIIEVVEKVEELEQSIQSLHSSYKGEITIATIPSLFITYLPKILAAFKQDYPELKVNIIEMEYKMIMEAVQNDEVDIGFIALFSPFSEKQNDQIDFRSLHLEGNFMIIVPGHSPLALKEKVTMEDIKNQSFILYDRDFYERIFEGLKGKDIQILFKTTNTEVIKHSVAEGLGISMLTNMMLKDDPYIKSGHIKAIPMNFQFTERIEFCAIHKKNNEHIRLIQKFYEYLE